MAMISWGASLPQAPEKKHTVVQSSGLSSVEDELSVRRARTYPDFTATFIFRQCTAAQLQALRVFYNVTVNQTSTFTAPWLANVGFTHHFCMFSEAPTAACSGYKWDITIRLFIMSSVPVNDSGDIVYGSVA